MSVRLGAGMQLRFGPDEEEAFRTTQQELLGRFGRWLEAGGRSLDAAADADSLLYFKWGYVDGDLGYWTVGHLEALLLGIYPRKVVADGDLLDGTIPSVQTFLEFLDHEGLLTGASDRLPTLTDALSRMQQPFRDAMGDRSRWGLGKSLLGGMADDGVDPSDQDAMDAWIDSFNAGSVEERDRVLGPAMQQIVPHIEEDQMFRPVVLPPTEVLEAAALAAPALRRIAGLAEYFATERRLTDNGNLTLADARHLVEALDTGDRMDETIGDRTFKTRSSTELETLDLTFRVAHQGGFVKIRKGKLSATKAGRRIDQDPLGSIQEAVSALLQTGVSTHRWADDTYGLGWYAHDVDAEVIGWLLDWYELGRQQIDELTGDTWQFLNGLYDLSDVETWKLESHRRFVDHGVRRILGRLEEFGIVAVEDVTEVSTELGLTEEHGGTVELTGLGLWLVNRLASEWADAPVVGMHADADAATLLRHSADLRDEVARAEIDAWIAAREPAVAAAGLAEALRTAGPAELGLGFAALRRLGREGVDAVRRLTDDDRLAPYVMAWRIDLLDLPVGAAATDDPDQQIRRLHAVLGLWDSRVLPTWLEMVVGVGGGTPEEAQRIAAAVEQLWRPRSDEALQVLDAVAAHHTDKRIAKAARKALFKLRSAGLG